MKNVERLTNTSPAFRVKLHGAPPLRGWAIQYVSGISDPEIKTGFWLSQWYPEHGGTSVRFNFESELVMCFNEEPPAMKVSDVLRQYCEIETKVVHLP